MQTAEQLQISSVTEICAAIERALKALFERDSFLLQSDANERSITHRLAMYLQSEFPLWDVDCEYNRDRLNPKVTMLPSKKKVSVTDEHARTVYPDIIVHKRDSDVNLLVVEVKKSSNPDRGNWDETKLKSYLRKPLIYRFAYFVSLKTDDTQRENWTLKPIA